MRAAAIIIKDNKILLMHRIKDGREYWVFPGGHVEDGETPEQAAIREIMEELTLKASNPKLAFNYQNGENEDPMFIVDVENKDPVLGGPEGERNSGNDFYEPVWIAFDNLKDLNLLPESAKEKLLKYFDEIS